MSFFVGSNQLEVADNGRMVTISVSNKQPSQHKIDPNTQFNHDMIVKLTSDLMNNIINTIKDIGHIH